MTCLYCTSRAQWCYGYLTEQKRYVCGTCRGLTEAGLWPALASRWLAHRPEDWCDDVAGFLDQDHRARPLAHSYPVRVDRRGRRHAG